MREDERGDGPDGNPETFQGKTMARLPTLPRATWLEMTMTGVSAWSDHVALEERPAGAMRA
jgi:hypothetical protein